MADNNESQRQRKKENFLRQFRDEQSKEIKQLTAGQFMEIWSHYDKDGTRKHIILSLSLSLMVTIYGRDMIM